MRKTWFLLKDAILLLPVILIASTCSFLPVTSSHGQPDEEGMAGFWHFEEGQGEIAGDSSVNCNKGTIRGAEWVEGISGKGLNFDGKTGYVDCGNPESMKMGTGDFTLEAWIKTDSARTNDTVIQKVQDTYIPYFSFFIEGNKIRVLISKGGPSATGADWAISDTSVTDGKWHHVAGVFDRINGKILIYVDGKEDASADIKNVAKDISMNNSGNLIIGAGPSGTDRFFPGLIDEVRIYKKAVSEEDIKERYNKNASAAKPAEDKTKLAERDEKAVRFGISADFHSRKIDGNIRVFIDAMLEWKPDFVIDMGDFAIQTKSGETTPELQNAQLKNLADFVAYFSRLACPAYYVVGNHDVGWLKGGDETLKPENLYTSSRGGEHITKEQWIEKTKMPGRYYSFDIKGYHFIVLDGNNWWSGSEDVPRGRDGVRGAYWIDEAQIEWLEKDLAANREKPKIIFCHEETHHTPPEGSGQGGEVPFHPVGKETSYVDNGWQIRELLAKDGKVIACFAGHKHDNRWTVYDKINYITLNAGFNEGSYSKVIISDKTMEIEGAGAQKSYKILLKLKE
ncbi:MAG: metallophosphoesterase [Candidatus Omnitrophica bacterium]|nr:metallophosphoesterase [Candidatus Omnitrophota bacterium]